MKEPLRGKAVLWSVLAFLAFLAVGCKGEGPPPRASGPSDAHVRTMLAVSAAEPQAVALEERAVYLDAIEQWGGSGGRPSPAESPEPRRPDMEAVRKVLGLKELVGDSDPALAARIRTWLLARVDELASAYNDDAAKVRALPPTSRWRQIEAGFITWLNRALPTLTEEELGHVEWKIEDLVRYDKGVNAFAGVDRIALGMAAVDLWIRAGHPKPDRNRHLFYSVLCAVEVRSGMLRRSCDSDGWWYKEQTASEAGTRRLAQAVLARRDRDLARTVAVAMGRTSMTLTFLAEIEKDAALWQTAVIAISSHEERAWTHDFLLPELRRAWKTYPDRRGAILYSVAQASTHPEAELPVQVVGFLNFTRDWGSGVGRTELVAFLDQHPRAIELLAWLMPARTPGWSVVDVLVPRLEAYFALSRDTADDAPRGPGFERIVSVLCKEHAFGELAKLRTYFERRAPAHPGDRLNMIMDSYTPKTCRAR
jgi:hypothetical protein